MSEIDATALESAAASPVVHVPKTEWAVMLVAVAAMSAMTALAWWSISWVETIGFATGSVCVWLAVRQHNWTWPIGIANNVFFFVLFLQGRLFADAYLQIVYLVLGAYGWWYWISGSAKRSELRVTRAPVGEIAILVAIAAPATWGLREVLVAHDDAAPFLDALTTVMSLAAQALMCRKRLESWYVWIAVDIIYVPLYLSRELPLTAVLYGMFMVMCIAGHREWARAAVQVKAGVGAA